GRFQHWMDWTDRQAPAAGFILPPPAANQPAPAQIEQAITSAFTALGPAGVAWGFRSAWCESRYDPLAVNKTPVGNEHAEGLFQFLPSTFAGTPQGHVGQSIWDPV